MKFNVLIVFFVFLIKKSIQGNSSSEPLLETRIVGGRPARAGQFPYQVAVIAFLTHGMRYMEDSCGGTIISKRHILTAAHCLIKGDTNRIFPSVHVFAGKSSIIDPFNEREQAIEVGSESLIPHQNYNPKTKVNDIALIILPRDLRFNNLISSAKLPKRSYTSSRLLGFQIISSGWGRTNDNAGSTSKHLLYMKSKILKEKKCSMYNDFFNPESQICINSPGVSICQGDSGGPNVVRDSSGEPVVMGVSCAVSSYGCMANHPQILTRVSFFLDWIHEKTGIPIEN